jgi:S-formylglutathione hydrolase FrmB
MQLLLLVSIALVTVVPARAQVPNCSHGAWANHHLAGRIVNYTNRPGHDCRIFSSILGMPRDLSVYLPPRYDPSHTYPIVLFFHMANVDERYFVGSRLLREIDNLILQGGFPPAIVACPDGSYGGWNPFNARHSLYINGLGGRFKDHILQEIIPFLIANYSVRPERQAHALIGFSAGGYGAMSMAIEHRDYFGAIVTLAAALNLRYSNTNGVYFEDFNPATYRWKTYYDPDEVIGVFYAGLRQVRARKFMEPVFGEGNTVVERITRTNPADLIFSTDLQPRQLAIYVGYPGRDNFNFDAQTESFCWLAAQKGIDVTVVCDPQATHGLTYFRDNMRPALIWLREHLLGPAFSLTPPTALCPPEDPQPSAIFAPPTSLLTQP